MIYAKAHRNEEERRRAGEQEIQKENTTLFNAMREKKLRSRNGCQLRKNATTGVGQYMCFFFFVIHHLLDESELQSKKWNRHTISAQKRLVW